MSGEKIPPRPLDVKEQPEPSEKVGDTPHPIIEYTKDGIILDFNQLSAGEQASFKLYGFSFIAVKAKDGALEIYKEEEGIFDSQIDTTEPHIH